MQIFVGSLEQKCHIDANDRSYGDTQRTLLTSEVIPKEHNELGIWVGFYILAAWETTCHYYVPRQVAIKATAVAPK